MTELHLSPGRLTLDQLRSVWTNPVAVELDRNARARIDAAADTVAGVIAEGRIVYGVNTGFGLLARTHIDATRLAELQRALVLSHSAGTGPPLDDAVVRLTLLLKIASLARGYSGVRYEVVDALLKLLKSGVVPVVPSQGSVGASGDLAPLAHLARVLRELLAGSAIRASHRDCPRVQDPYSLRCQPQVMGACLDQMRRVAEVLLTEADAVSDNPLVFPETREVLAGGNFHGEPVAFAADGLALAIAEIGALSERRTALLMDANLSGLPSFLVRDGGVNSGFMIAQVTAAALAAENKAMA